MSLMNFMRLSEQKQAFESHRIEQTTHTQGAFHHKRAAGKAQIRSLLAIYRWPA